MEEEVDSQALAEKRRAHREEFKRNLSGEEVLVNRLRETRRLLAQAEARANEAEAQLVRDDKNDSGPLERYVAVVEATKIAAVSTLRSELEVCRCALVVSDIKRAVAEARCADFEESNDHIMYNFQKKSSSSDTTSIALKQSETKINKLQAEIQTKDARVKMLEEHLAKMDAHLAALAQSNDSEVPELDFEALDEKNSTKKEDTSVLELREATIDEDVRQELALVKAALEGADKAARQAEAKAQAEEKRSQELECNVLASRKQAEEQAHAQIRALENLREIELELSAAQEAMTIAQEERATMLRECEQCIHILSRELDEETSNVSLLETAEHCAQFIKETKEKLKTARIEKEAAVEEIESKAYLNESRADAAEARLETLKLKLDTAQEQAEIIKHSLREKIDEAETRATNSLRQLHETEAKLDQAEQKLNAATKAHLLQEEHAASLSIAASENLATLQLEKDRELEAAFDKVQKFKNDTHLAWDAALTADIVCAALRDQLQHERNSLLEERDLALARAKAQVERYRQLAEDSKEAATQAYTESMQNAKKSVPSSTPIFRVVATLARCLEQHSSSIQRKRFALATWRIATERDCWLEMTVATRGRLTATILGKLKKSRFASVWSIWCRAIMKKKEIQASSVQQRLQVADRVAAAAADVSAAAKLARYTSNDYDDHTRVPLSQHYNRRGPVLFRRCVDASGGVIGIDGNELCPAYQFGNCQQQHETGLVVHHLPDGGLAWHWHACVACARVTGRMANHPRFGVSDSQPSQCPITERINDRVYEVLPSDSAIALPSSRKNPGHANVSVSTNSRLRYQDQCIKNYEKQRTELMSALGTALTSLHALGASYPHWVWDLYERSRLERYTRFVSTSM